MQFRSKISGWNSSNDNCDDLNALLTHENVQVCTWSYTYICTFYTFMLINIRKTSIQTHRTFKLIILIDVISRSTIIQDKCRSDMSTDIDLTDSYNTCIRMTQCLSSLDIFFSFLNNNQHKWH